MNLEPIVLIWSTVSIIGTAYAIDALATANDDDDLVRERAAKGSSERRLRELECAVTRNDIISARWIVAQELAFLAVGLLALSQPPNHHRSPLGWAIISLLIFGAAVLPIRLAGQRRRRRRIVRPHT